ncbi:hypothetical protein, partial [Mycoplasma nasistruthionis]
KQNKSLKYLTVKENSRPLSLEFPGYLDIV